MLLPIAHALDGRPRQGFLADLERFFWCVTFAQTYAQGSNTQAVADARSLRAWQVSDKAIPGSVSSFRVDEVALQDQRRRNEMLVAGVGCLLAKRNARDWMKPAFELHSATENVEFHHIYAKRYLEHMGVEESDVVANLTVVLASTNQSLRNDSPDVVAARTDIERSAVESHAIDWERFCSANWNDFLDDRVQRLRSLIDDVTG